LYDNPKRKKLWVDSGQSSTSTAKPNIYVKKVLMNKDRATELIYVPNRNFYFNKICILFF